jgi:hypothetical protein
VPEAALTNSNRGAVSRNGAVVIPASKPGGAGRVCGGRDLRETVHRLTKELPPCTFFGYFARFDVVFAVDSIPAILAVTRDTFVVYAANAFSLLGLAIRAHSKSQRPRQGRAESNRSREMATKAASIVGPDVHGAATP